MPQAGQEEARLCSPWLPVPRCVAPGLQALILEVAPSLQLRLAGAIEEVQGLLQALLCDPSLTPQAQTPPLIFSSSTLPTQVCEAD